MSDCDDRATSGESDVVWVDDSGEVRAPEGTVLSIANVAKMFGVTQLSLRYYERRGLIVRRYRVGRLRVYGWAECDRIAFIIKGQRVGLSISEMAIIIKAADRGAAAATIKAGRAKCLDLIDRLERRRQPLRDALGELRQLHALLSRRLVGNADGGETE
jgi:DNA-binding transcriptional MerR regulator